MIAKTFILNENITFVEKKCIKSWLKNNYKVEIYSFYKINFPNTTYKNANKICNIEDIIKIKDIYIKKLYFILKLVYKIGGLVFFPDVFSNNYYNFTDNLVSTQPKPDYNSQFKDFNIIYFRKGHKYLEKIMNHFWYFYNDYKDGYNKNIIETLNLIDKEMYEEDWNFFNNCNNLHWKSQIGINFNTEKFKSLKGKNIKIRTDICKENYFIKIFQDEIYNYLNTNENISKECLLHKILR